MFKAVIQRLPNKPPVNNLNEKPLYMFKSIKDQGNLEMQGRVNKFIQESVGILPRANYFVYVSGAARKILLEDEIKGFREGEGYDPNLVDVAVTMRDGDINSENIGTLNELGRPLVQLPIYLHKTAAWQKVNQGIIEKLNKYVTGEEG